MKSMSGQQLQNMDAEVDFKGAAFCMGSPKQWDIMCAESCHNRNQTENLHS